MGKLIYSMNVSLDGYVATPEGGLDWSIVDEEVHGWWNDQQRQEAAALYGRRLYETMAYWHTAESDPDANEVMLDFARAWNATPKIVFSSTLESVGDGCRLVQTGAVEAWPALREEFEGDVSVGGPTLASAFIRAGLVDEYRLVVNPVVLGAGLPFFPQLDEPIRLELLETHRFASGATYLRYAALR
ncbi:MAG TPA: dihydrofolate reductase family protein [Candidatus Limnocylindria bacterium]|nr:dihydrofolate reductase family protein [Candidatus Limnocylindria bacterium]